MPTVAAAKARRGLIGTPSVEMVARAAPAYKTPVLRLPFPTQGASRGALDRLAALAGDGAELVDGLRDDLGAVVRHLVRAADRNPFAAEEAREGEEPRVGRAADGAASRFGFGGRPSIAVSEPHGRRGCG